MERAQLFTTSLSRPHLRYLTATQKNSPATTLFFIILPQIIDFIWIVLYFVERDMDTFYPNGPCDNITSRLDPQQGQRYPSPFFTTYRPVGLWETQVCFALLTACFWMPYRYMKPTYASRFVQTFTTLAQVGVDVLTVLPFLISLIFFPAYVAYVPSYLRIWMIHFEFNAFIRYLEIKNWVTVYRIINLVTIVLGMTISTIGLFEWSENNFPFNPVYYGVLASGGVLDLEFPCVTFLESLYFFLVTFSTVGYGDVVPTNDVARGLVILLILIFLISAPLFVTTVFDILSDARNLKLNHFSKRKAQVEDLLVVDSRYTTAMGDTLIRVLGPKYLPLEVTPIRYVIVLSKEDLQQASQQVDHRAIRYTKLFFVQGSVEVEEDLERCQAAFAKCVYIFPESSSPVQIFGEGKTYRNMFNNQGENPPPHAHHDEQVLHAQKDKYRGKLSLRRATDLTREYCIARDYNVLRRVWALQAQLPRARYRALLFHYSNRHFIEKIDPVCPNCSGHLVMYADLLEQKIGAANVICPGLAPLFVSLILCGTIPSRDTFYAKVNNENRMEDAIEDDCLAEDDENENGDSSTTFKQSVSDGFCYADSLCSNALVKLPYLGATKLELKAVRILVYDHFGVLVLGFYPLKRKCARLYSFHPENFLFNVNNEITKGDFLICLGSGSVLETMLEEKQWTKALTVLLKATSSVSLNPHSVIPEDSPSSSSFEEKEDSTPPQNHTSRAKEDSFWRMGQLMDGEHFNRSERYVNSTRKRTLRESHVSDVRPMSSQADIDDDDDEDEEEGIPDEEENQYETRVRDRDVDIKEDNKNTRSNRTPLKDHIIICSGSQDTFIHIVRHLRQKNSQYANQPILLFDASMNHFKWSELTWFDNVYHMTGRPFIQQDLLQAGFQDAKCLLLLTDLRMRYEAPDTESCLNVDRNNLLALRIARRLKRHLHSNIRIITHTKRKKKGREDTILVLRDKTFPTLLQLQPVNEKETAILTSFTRYQEAWPPLVSKQYVCGEAFSPSCFPLLFFCGESKGDWLLNFEQAFLDQAGISLCLEELPTDYQLNTFDECVWYFLKQEKGALVLGVYRNFSNEDALGNTVFKGAILYPELGFRITKKDRLFVLRSNLDS